MSGLNSRTSSGFRVLERTNLVNALVTTGLKANGDDVSLQGFNRGEFNKIQNENGEFVVNDVVGQSPLQVSNDKGIATIALNVDAKEISNNNGLLTTVNKNYEYPLGYDIDSRTIGLQTSSPIGTDQNGLTLFHDETMVVDEQGKLSVQFPQEITFEAPLSKNVHTVSVNYNPTYLTVNNNGQLEVVKEGIQDAVDESIVVDAPLRKRDEDRHIVLEVGKGLDVNDDGQLQTNLNNILKPLGALHSNGLLDIGDDFLEYGYEAIDEIFGDGEDTEVKLLRLKTSDDFTQKGSLFGSKVLAIRNKGANRIPYYATISDEFDTRDSFRYNETLNELNVGHVSLTPNSNPSSNEAVTQDYLQYYLTEGSGIEIASQINNKRAVSVKYDATLATNQNGDLGVNVTPLVNGSSIRVVDGKIASGLIFQPANGVKLREGTNNDVVLALKTQGALEMVDNATIKDSITASKGLERIENDISLNLTSKNSQILVDNETGSIEGNVQVKADSGLVLNENVLDLNKSAIIDNDTLTVNNGKITGTNYHFGNGFEVDTQIGSATVNLDFKTDDDLSWNQQTATFSSKLQGDGTTVVKQGNTLKGNYQGNNGVSVTGNNISGAYTAGNNISINGSTISCTYQPEPEAPTVITGALPIIVTGADKDFNVSKQPLVISGGAGIIVAGSESTGYVISSTQPYKNRRDDDDPDEKNEESEPAQQSDPLTATSSTPIVSMVGPLGGALAAGASLIGAAPAAGVAASATSAFGAIGVLAGAAGGVGVIGGFLQESGRRRENKKDASGNNIMDSDGNPVLEDGSEVIVATFPKIIDSDCDVTRLLFDTPSACSWRGVKYEYGQQAVNLDILKEYDSAIISPNYTSLISQNTALLQQSIDSKVSKTGSFPYGQLTGTPDLGVYERKLTFTGPLLSRDTSNVISVNTGSITSVGTLSSLSVSGATVTTGSITAPTLNVGGIVVQATTGFIKFRHDTAAAKGDYSISYKNSGDALHIHLAGADDASGHRQYQFGYYTNDTYGTWNSRLSVDTYSGGISASGPSTFASTLTLATSPVNINDVTNKGYVDSLISTASTGLTKVGNAFSINAAQPTITSLGTLNTLTVSGASIFNGAITIQAPTIATNPATKAYVDSLISTTSSGAQPSNAKLTAISSSTASLNNFLVGDGSNFVSTTPAASRTALGLGSVSLLNSIPYSTLTGLPPLGALSSKDSVDLGTDVGTSVLLEPRIDTLIARKSYVDSTVAAQTPLAGTGLTKTGVTFSVNPAQTQITSVGTLSSLSVGGNLNLLGSSQTLSFSGNYFIDQSSAGSQILLGYNTPKSVSGESRLQILSNSTDRQYLLTVNSRGTSGGTDYVYIGGGVDSTSPTTGALQVAGGVGIAKNLNIGASCYINSSVATNCFSVTSSNVNQTSGLRMTNNLGNYWQIGMSGGTPAGVYAGAGAGGFGIYNGVTNAMPLYITSADYVGISNLSLGTLRSNLQMTKTGATTSCAIILNNSTNGTYGYIGLDGSGMTAIVQDAMAILSPPSKPIALVNYVNSAWVYVLKAQDGIVSISTTTDSVSTTSGALQVAGGLSVNKSLSIGIKSADTNPGLQIVGYARDNLQIMFDMFDSGSGIVASHSSAFRILKNGGNLNFAGASGLTVNGAVTTTPIIMQLQSSGNVVLNSTTDIYTTGTPTGSALLCQGSIRTNKSLMLGLSTNISTVPAYVGTAAVDGVMMRTYADPNNLMGEGTWARMFDIVSSGESSGTEGGAAMRFLTNPRNSTACVERMRIKENGCVVVQSTTDSTSINTGALQVAGGFGVSKSLSVGGQLLLSTAANPPTFTTTSAGTKIIINPSLSGTASNYSIGSEAYHTWFNVPVNDAQWGFKWYGGTTQIARLDGVGNLSISSAFTAGGNLVTGSHLFINNSSSSDTVAFQSLLANGFSSVKFLDNTGAYQMSFGYANSTAVTYGGNVFMNTAKPFLTNTPSVILQSAIDSTSVGSGALQVAGGVGIGKSLNVGANLSVTGSLTADVVNVSTLNITSLGLKGEISSPSLNSSNNYEFPPGSLDGETTNLGSPGNLANGTYSNSGTYSTQSGLGPLGNDQNGWAYTAFSSSSAWWQPRSDLPKNLSINGTTQSGNYNVLQLPLSVKISSVKITPVTSLLGNTPRVFQVVAGTSLNDMVSLGTFTVTSWSAAKTFYFDNTTAYPWYGIFISAVNGSYAAINRIQFFSNSFAPSVALVNPTCDTLGASGNITANCFIAAQHGILTHTAGPQVMTAGNGQVVNGGVSNLTGQKTCIVHVNINGIIPMTLNTRLSITVQLIRPSDSVVVSSGTFDTYNDTSTRTNYAFSLPLFFSPTSNNHILRLTIPTTFAVTANSYVTMWSQTY